MYMAVYTKVTKWRCWAPKTSAPGVMSWKSKLLRPQRGSRAGTNFTSQLTQEVFDVRNHETYDACDAGLSRFLVSIWACAGNSERLPGSSEIPRPQRGFQNFLVVARNFLR